VLMILSAVDDPGVVILPTHRVVRGVAPERLARLPGVLAASFRIDILASEADLRAALAEAGRTQPAFGLCAPALGDARVRLLRLRDRTLLDRLPQDRSAAWRELDVSIAHHFILEEGLGVRPEAVEEHVTYTRDADEALAAVRAGQGQVALLLNPTRTEQVCAVARAGDRMPQKSTYFYPKLLTGLVIHHLAGRLPDPQSLQVANART
jgi:hypothetical protein